MRDANVETHVPHGAQLLEFVEAVMQGDPATITEVRNQLQNSMSESAVVDASTTIAMFSIMDRIADATGIPIDAGIAHDSRLEIGAQLGMDYSMYHPPFAD